MKVVGIKFKKGGKVYYFAPKDGEVYEKGMPVVVETSKALEFAFVDEPEKEVDEKDVVAPLKPIVRIATQKDITTQEERERKKPSAMQTCKEKIEKHGLDMKLVDCEYAFDGSKLTFYFYADERVDFRELVKDLGSTFRTRIDLCQIGSRDETKLLGGIAPCGRVCCCAGNMPECKKVSIKMAKQQGLSLNPGKISGLCGKLMCCLAYESEYYEDAYKKMPKLGAEADTPDGRGNVVSVNMLKMTVKVKIDDKQGGLIYKDFPLAEIRFKKGNAPAGNKKDEDED